MSPTFTVRVSDQAGNETVATKAFSLGGGETIITGDFAGAVPVGTVARLRGNVRLIGDLHVRGTLLCDPTGVDLDGQGLWDIHTHDGTLNLIGTAKTAWCNWGDSPVGWQVGDRLAVAPTAVGVFVPSEIIWQGSWAATTRPVNSPDVTLVDASIARPEVVNLSQTVTLRNLKRIMIHEATAPNPHTLKWIRVLNSGVAGELGMYPIHFHMIGDHARGSILEGVVVEGGKNHAFVPHASHGIIYTGCVAYKTTGTAYWWDLPPDDGDPINDSVDLLWGRCLSMGVVPSSTESSRLAGFSLGAGRNVACVDSVAVGVHGNPTAGENNRQRSGFVWPQNAGRESWRFQRNVGHNNVDNGLLVWQNARAFVNLIEDFTAYHNGFEGVNHGAYQNRYHFRGLSLTGNGFRQHAKSSDLGPLIVEDVLSDTRLYMTKHVSGFQFPTFYRNARFPSVVYNEPSEESYNIYEDCGLVPANFDLAGIAADSIIEIKESGVLTHRWQSGVWS